MADICPQVSSAGTISSLGGQTRRVGRWVDSIRQVDVDLNFLLVLYSTVGLYRLVCLSGRLDICWENFLGGQNTLAVHPML